MSDDVFCLFQVVPLERFLWLEWLLWVIPLHNFRAEEDSPIHHNPSTINPPKVEDVYSQSPWRRNYPSQSCKSVGPRMSPSMFRPVGPPHASLYAWTCSLDPMDMENCGWKLLSFGWTMTFLGLKPLATQLYFLWGGAGDAEVKQLEASLFGGPKTRRWAIHSGQVRGASRLKIWLSISIPYPLLLGQGHKRGRCY